MPNQLPTDTTNINIIHWAVDAALRGRTYKQFTACKPNFTDRDVAHFLYGVKLLNEKESS
jgi:hypothetical protein